MTKPANFTSADVDAILESWKEDKFTPEKATAFTDFHKSIAVPLIESDEFMKFGAELTSRIIASTLKADIKTTIACLNLFIELGYRLKEAELSKVPEKETVNA